MDSAFRAMEAEAVGFEPELKKMPEEQAHRDIDISEHRKRVVALQQSAANLAQLDLNTLAKLLPPNMAPQQVYHIKNKLLQLNSLQHRRAERSLSVNDAPEVSENRCSSRYKTELCRPFEENGSCKYGIRCQFAHGVDELRTMTRHPKYKSQLCRTFHSNGLCPYGHRCHFIHNKDEIITPPGTQPLVDLNNNYMGNSSSSLDILDNGSRRSSVSSMNVTNPQMSMLSRQSLYRSNSVDVPAIIPNVRSASISVFPKTLPRTERIPINKSPQLWSNPPNSKDIPHVPRPHFYSLACSVSSSDGLSPPHSPIQGILEDPFSPLGNNKNNVHFFGGPNTMDYNSPMPVSNESGGDSPNSLNASPIDKFYMPEPFKMEVWKNEAQAIFDFK